MKRVCGKLLREDPVVAGLVQRCIVAFRGTLAEDDAVGCQKCCYIVQGHHIMPHPERVIRCRWFDDLRLIVVPQLPAVAEAHVQEDNLLRMLSEDLLSRPHHPDGVSGDPKLGVIRYQPIHLFQERAMQFRA